MLYARNLLLSTTEETIEDIFSQFAEVERVKKIKDYCFVHFTTKEGARKALDAMQGMIIFTFVVLNADNVHGFSFYFAIQVMYPVFR